MSLGPAVKRTSHILLPNPCRVIAKPHLPGEEIAPGDPSRASLLMDRIPGISSRGREGVAGM
jgi:hypothetical protein